MEFDVLILWERGGKVKLYPGEDPLIGEPLPPRGILLRPHPP